MKKNQVINYFKAKAQKYDLVENQVYWRLSDKLLWYCFNKILKELPRDFVFLDAGGGTGRWSIKILQNYPKSQGVIYDISIDMLSVAREKRKKLGLKKRLKIVYENIQKPSKIKNKKFHLVFNFHNVLGFVSFPGKTIKTIAQLTKNKGYIVSFVPNLYHNIFFNIFLNRIDEAEYSLKKLKGRFTKEMPYIHLFTPSKIKKIYQKANIEIINIKGFPMTIYPDYQETQITGSSKEIVNILDNKNSFYKIYKIEKSLLKNNDAAARGNNIFIVGKK